MNKGNFSHNVVKLTIGNSVAQVISVATVPIITRLYDPTQFGEFAIFLGIAALIVPISTLQFHATIMLPKDDCTAWSLRTIASYSVVLISLLCLVGTAITVLWAHYNNWDMSLVSSGVIWLIAPVVLFQGMLLINTTWIMRMNEFGKAATTRVWESLA